MALNVEWQAGLRYQQDDAVTRRWISTHLCMYPGSRDGVFFVVEMQATSNTAADWSALRDRLADKIMEHIKHVR